MFYTKCFSNKTLYIFSECFVCVCVYTHTQYIQTNIYIYIFFTVSRKDTVSRKISLSFLIKKMFNEKYGNVERIV